MVHLDCDRINILQFSNLSCGAQARQGAVGLPGSQHVPQGLAYCSSSARVPASQNTCVGPGHLAALGAVLACHLLFMFYDSVPYLGLRSFY